MAVPDEVFDDDYLYFYAEVVGPERSNTDAETVIQLLDLEPGLRVLDAPCGEGRIGGRLARHGCDVVGIDSNERFIALARERYPEARFEEADLRELDHQEEFDAVVNWFTSFGYFDRPTNDRVLEGFARALKPGGRLLLELHNPERLKKILELTGGVATSMVERDGDLLVDRVRLEGAESRSYTERWIVRGGQTRKVEFSLEQVPAEELVLRLQSAGFSEVRLFGSGGAVFDPDGPRIIALAAI